MSEKESKPEVRPGMYRPWVDGACSLISHGVLGAILIWVLVLVAFMICSLVHGNPRVLGERGGGVEVDDGR